MWRNILRIATGILCTAALVPVAAQQPPPPQTCQNESEYRQFDFWLGEWDVFVNGRQAGTNSVTKEEGGCLVLEKWTDVTGGTGQSYNFYNPDTGLWRQVWVSSYMTIDYAGGLTEDGSMELVGEITYYHTGQSLKFLGRWTLQDDGTVRQYFEQADPETGEMTPIFTGIYHRRSGDTG